MRYRQLHRWDVSPRRAAAIQVSLRAGLALKGGLPSARLAAGADVSYDPRTEAVHAAIVVVSLPSLQVVETATATGRARFPYIPGYLSFREAPVLLKAFRKLRSSPDLLLCDGQGIAHPRGFGLASHLGLILDVPSIGCAKSRLVGEHAEPGMEEGAYAPLHYRGRTVGAVLRTRGGVKPIYVSVGHRIGLRAAIRWCLACCDGRRVPAPTRLADVEVNRMRAGTGQRSEA